ncbi:ImmA/IrrE family metallo-endopeptidase [Enterovirga sp. CN4-39]|uniref:ImmA/IrrE family metallo-endopeptidase n=1 Tax=Enterovirga sp. CN4-39 TaxID=3400910 RepID=UPI003C068E2F
MAADEIEIVRQLASGEGPVDVARLIKALGVDYSEQPMAPGVSGKIQRIGDRYRIVVNSKEGPQRRRFTAAHELGHYLLHRDLVGERGHLDRLFSSGSSGVGDIINPLHEVQANRFAAELLMPSGAVRARAKTADNPVDLARHFGVSPAAMTVRMESLGLRPPARLSEAPPPELIGSNSE